MKKLVLSAFIASCLSAAAWADFAEGIAAYDANNLPLAAKEFRKSAEKGHADSQFNLGLMYEKGMGVPKDEAQALVWYRKAAEQGNGNAQYNLGVMYENGMGTKIDFAQAHQWYRKAAVQGDELAVGNLGMLYVRGQGVKENKIAGVALLMLSATMNNSPENNAKSNLAKIKGLSAADVTAAQTLSGEMSNAKNMLTPLDQYLKNPSAKAAAKPKT